MGRTAGGGLALALLLSSCGSASESAEPATGAPTAPAAPAVDEAVSGQSAAEESLRFLTPDNQELAGTLFGAGTRGIVLAHMRGRDESTWFDFARTAAGNGFFVLTFSFRGYGDSSGERDTDLDVDLIAAVHLLQSRGAADVVVMGASMGGTATVNVAARLALAGAVSLSAPADFIGLAALDVANQITEPLLVVAARKDQPYADAAAAMSDAAPAARLQIFEGNAHGTNLFGDYQVELTNLLLEFASERLG